ncbi:hypothetical protein [Bacillus marinisedimentorum]|nr:hypothetical protein [Bacillus marinisedimentorum]
MIAFILELIRSFPLQAFAFTTGTNETSVPASLWSLHPQDIEKASSN